MERELTGIIAAKVRVPPARRGMLERTSILDGLAETGASVLLVQAPAGFGKSTVLEQWAHVGDRPFAWVSLDSSEDDPTVFWRHVYAALRVCIPSFAPQLHDEITKAGPDLAGFVIPGILNDLGAVEAPVVIVLDDYHRVNSAEVDNTIKLFIRHLPPGVTLAMGTRTRPALGMARLRSRGLIHELDASDLNLTLDDTAAVLRARKPDRTDGEVAWVHEATEGWPVGVYLFGLLDEIDTDARTTTDIRDYLMTEVFSNLSPRDLRFMRETSILSHLEAGSCDHVTGGASSQTTLERLASSNLLISPLDDVGDQYRYHHLLQAELESRLAHEESPDDVAELHLRAMEWTATNGEVTEAIRHAIHAGNIDAAVALVAEHWYEFIMSGRAASAYQWMGNFTEHEVRTQPALMLSGAMLAAFTGHDREARELAAGAQVSTHTGSGFVGAATYESSVAIMRAGIAADGPQSALADARQAAELEPIDSPYRPMLASMIGTFIYSTAVQDSEAYPLLLEGTRAATGPPEMAAYALANLGLMHAWRNEADTALSYARQAIRTVDETKVGGLLLYGLPYAIAAWFSFESDGARASRELMRNAEQAESTASNGAPFDSMTLRTTMAEAYVAMGEYEAARKLAERALGNLAVMIEGGLVTNRLDHVIRMINRADPNSDGQFQQEGLLLSPREVQILGLLATDETLEGIGRRLYVSRNTVKTHTSRIYRKLGVSGRRQAVAEAHRLSLV